MVDERIAVALPRESHFVATPLGIVDLLLMPDQHRAQVTEMPLADGTCAVDRQG